MRGKREISYRELPAVMCTPEVCAERVSAVLQREFGEQRNVPKRMARWFEPRAWKNWYYGVNAPRMHELVKLLAVCDGLKQELDLLVAQEKSRIK